MASDEGTAKLEAQARTSKRASLTLKMAANFNQN